MVVGLLLLLVACGNQAAPLSDETAATATVAPAAETSDQTPVVPASGPERDPGEGNAESVLLAATTAMSDLDDYQATIDLTLLGPQNGEISMDVAMLGSPLADNANDSRFRGEVSASSIPSIPAGSIVVLGPAFYWYQPETNMVFTGEQSGYVELMTLFLSTQTRAAQLASSAIAVGNVVGEEQVGEFNTIRVDFIPRPGVEGTAALGRNVQASIWFDQETKLPVQLIYRSHAGGMEWSMTNLAINSGLDESIFTFEPPPDARVVDLGTFEAIPVESLDEASREAGFPAPLPTYLPADLPTEPNRIVVQKTPLGNHIVSNYTLTERGNGDFPGFDDFTPRRVNGITIEAFQTDTPSRRQRAGQRASQVTEETIRGVPGTIVEQRPNRVHVSWDENGITYTVAGTGYDRDEVLQVVEGLNLDT
ncbi:MAG: DUF2092 domain-containing protein [Chloroflexaceae bacterium]|nr:DUF2092 domain-containing protein [Chloroflexaceae bacterium]